MLQVAEAAMANSPISGNYAPRRADDPTRFIPWLRDRNGAIGRISPRLLETFFEGASTLRVKRDAVLLAQGAPARRLFILISGTVTIRIESNGVWRELLSYNAGELAGLLALVDQGPSPYEIRAAVDSELVAVDAWRVARLCAAYHPSGVAIMDAFLPMLTDHLRQLDERAVRLAARKNASMRGSGATIRRDDR